MPPQQLPDEVSAALAACAESSAIEFKADMDFARCAPEVVKDIVALANNGGGVIVIGAKDDGSNANTDLALLSKLDPAQITDKVRKYINRDLPVQMYRVKREGADLIAILVPGVQRPFVMEQAGTYVDPKTGKDRCAFAQGTIYVRHGAKSEPATNEDIARLFDREIDRLRSKWTEGFAQVMAAPEGARLAVVDAKSAQAPLVVRLADAAAGSGPGEHIDKSHPYGAREVVPAINKRLGGREISSFDLLCVRTVHRSNERSDFCYVMNKLPTRYSPAFVEWVALQHEANPAFFEEARSEYRRKHAPHRNRRKKQR